MRWMAILDNPDNDLKRLMIYEYEGGAYLFGYSSTEDCSADWDEWYENAAEARTVCIQEHGVPETDWSRIPDVLSHCQHDWIAPVRVKGRDTGTPEWGLYEELVDGVWRPKE